jgi:UDP-N-acetylmuramyl pentapeptide phosphotransferase/UDP-N-acetylglucosamine-1-phosphate transferase
MGDSGSLTLGYTLGFLFVKYTMDTPATGEIKPDSMLLAYTLLIVPMFDVVRVSLVRLLHHTPIFKADNNHIHHKLMRAGFTQHQALICILALAIFFIVLNILLGIFAPFTTIVAIDVILWMIFHIVLDHKIKRKKRPVFMSPETSRTS